MKKIVFAIAIVLLASVCAVNAQTYQQEKDFVYPLQVTPHGFDCWSFASFFYEDNSVYNPRSKVFSIGRGEIASMKINPAGWSMAALSHRGNSSYISICDMWHTDNLYYKISDLSQPQAICYTPDARQLLIATPSQVLYYDTKNYEVLDTLAIPHRVNKMVVSDNGYYLAATDGHQVTVWNMEKKIVRKSFNLAEKVNDISFTCGSDVFAILSSDGLLALYDSRDFLVHQMIDGMGDAYSVSFHPNGKYASVVTGDSRIAILNLFDDNDRTYLNNDLGGIENSRFIHEASGKEYLAYNTVSTIVYHPIPMLSPNYTRLLTEELDDRMNEWMKMMPGETLDEYKLRVNDETREQQMRLIEEEIATRLANDLVKMSDVSLGNYSQETGVLAINFDRMPTIYLQVPGTEISDFLNVENLDFRNTRYGLTQNDRFEIVYVDVYNCISGKTYVFDNRERRVLDYLQSDDNFVPLDMVMFSSMEDMKLQEIKDRVVDFAKGNKTISDHTNISVSSRIIPTVDANGERIYNYRIGFSYEVEKNWSAREDFAPGKYKTEESGAAKSMISIIKAAFDTEFSQYLKSGKRVQIRIVGMADALPINGKIPYDGRYGEYISEPVILDGELGNVSVTRSSGVTQNEQLAFLRALGLKQALQQDIPFFQRMKADYRCDVQLSPYKGGEFRRISVEFTFVDAL